MITTVLFLNGGMNINCYLVTFDLFMPIYKQYIEHICFQKTFWIFSPLDLY